MPITSERTNLGYVLQLLVEEALKDASLRFIANHLYYQNFIKPDALIPGPNPTHSVHVTATGADNSFQMKRWRYIDEITQMRSVWEDKFVAINIMFGPLQGYQASDRQLLNHLFDYEIRVDDLEFGSITYQMAIELINSDSENLTNTKIASILFAAPQVKKLIKALATELKEAYRKAKVTNAPKVAIDALSCFLKVRESSITQTTLQSQENAFWKRTILAFLAVSPHFWNEIFNIRGRAVSEESLNSQLIVEGVRAKLLKRHIGIRTKISLHPEVEATLNAGLDKSFLADIHEKVSNNPRRKYELEDLWDNRLRATSAIIEVVAALKKGRAVLEELMLISITNGGSQTILHHRSHVIDILISAIGWSQNQLQSLYRGPSIGVADPIRNIVPRTEIAQQALRRNATNLPMIATAIVDAMWQEIMKVDWQNTDDLINRYLNYRVYCLIKGSSIDPLKDFVIASLVENKWELAIPNVVCAHPLVGRTKTQFTAAATKNGKRILIKCLFGDTGADHKAEEMEARIRLIRTCNNEWKDSITIFIADGNWSDNHKGALFLGGWDHIIPVNKFKNTIRSL